MVNVFGTLGDDIIDAGFVDAFGNSITAGSDRVDGDPGNDFILGIGGDDVLLGGFGDDTLIGGAGADAISGGAGTDKASYSTSSGGVQADLTTGTGKLSDAEGDTFFFIENLEGSSHDDILIGDSDSNVIEGGSGLDFIEGRGGADTLIGGGGGYTDAVGYIESPTGVTVSLLTGSASGGDATGDTLIGFENLAGSAFADTLTGDNFANAIGGGKGDDIIQGLAGNDNLGGGDGNDALDGGSGFDTMVGGAGNDTYFVDSVFDGIDETFFSNGDGIDTVASTISFNLTSAVQVLENLILLGTANINGTGNEVSNVILGNASNNILDGLDGADVMQGFGGGDTYFVDNVGDIADETGGDGIDTVHSTISFSLAEAAHAKGLIEDLVLLGSANLNGIGNTLANVITGNGGANLIDGQAGPDIMRGLGGNDTYVVDSLSDVVVEMAGGGIDTILASLSSVLAPEVENLTLLGIAAIDGSGNDLANAITGNAGPNLIDGKAGADIMLGLGGNDTYFVDNAGDVANETVAGSSGTDTVMTSLSFALGDGVENLVLTGAAAISGTGNALANTIAGNAAKNTLAGQGGADRFAFVAALNKKTNVDIILDFSHKDDTVVLDNAIFGKLKVEGVLKAKFLHEGKKAHDANDRIIYNDQNGGLIYDANGDHKGKAFKFAVLAEGLDLTKGDFFVV